MNLRRLWVLLRKDFFQGARSFLFIFGVIVPVAMTFILNLLFGSIFSETPRLGIVDAGEPSAFTTELEAADYLISSRYDSEDALLSGVEAGRVDVGLVVGDDFDARLQDTGSVDLTLYVWGESLLKSRAVVGAAVTDTIVSVSGRETPVEIAPVLLGAPEVPWSERLLPLLLIMAVVIGGTMLPASGLVEEKQKHTLRAVITTPVTLHEVFVSKGLLGAIVAVFVALLVLALNGVAFGAQTLSLLLVLGIGALLAAGFGVLLGALIKDINTLFAVIKGIGILLYMPAFLALFPEIPAWISYLFPTHYILNPVVQMSQYGATLGDVGGEVAILAVMTAAMIGGLGFLATRMEQQAAIA